LTQTYTFSAINQKKMAGAKEQGGVLSGVMPTTYIPSDPITLFIIQVIIFIVSFFH
jgi:hypothetical protein